MTCRLRWWSKSKPDVEFQYGERLGEFHGMSSRSHVSHCRVLPLGEFTVMIPKPRLCHIAGCNNSIRHIENRFSPYFIYFFNAVWALTRGSFRIVSDTLVNWGSDEGIVKTNLHVQQLSQGQKWHFSRSMYGASEIQVLEIWGAWVPVQTARGPNFIFNKNLAIANTSRVSCAHNSSRASPWPWNLR